VKVVVLTGAGISAESGVPTFRDADGLWEGHRVEDVASPDAFELQPSVVHRFYDARRAAIAGVEPNPAHHALARLEEHLGDDLLVVVHMHGRLRSALCRACLTRTPWLDDLGDHPPCPSCGVSELRPDVVWFGEMPYELDRIFAALDEADLFVAIGTSGVVYPAAAFVQFAAGGGARTLELNLVASDVSGDFDESRAGPAGVLVPAWVEELLAGEL
jgi:NAD-dependent deacetylase